MGHRKITAGVYSVRKVVWEETVKSWKGTDEEKGRKEKEKPIKFL